MAFRFPSISARRALRGLAVAAIATLAACGGDDSTGPSGDNYALKSIDGNSIPWTESDASGSYTVQSGTLSLKSNGTYTVRVTEKWQMTGEPAETFTYGENGTYVVSGSTITLTSTHDFDDGELTESAGEVYTGTKSGSTITFNIDDGMGGTTVVVFQK